MIMTKKRKTILFSIILILILIVSLIITIILIIINNKEDFGGKQFSEDAVNEYKDVFETQITKIDNNNTFFTIDELVKKYIDYYENNDNNAIIALLDSNYINDNNVNAQNVFNKIKKPTNSSQYESQDIYGTLGGTYISYYVKGTINNEEIFNIINIDKNNNTFSVIPTTKEKFDNRLKDKANNSDKNIAKNDYNIFEYKNLNDSDIVKLYFDNYIVKMLNNKEKAYEILDSTYKSKRYSTMDDFNEYVNNNKEKFELTYKYDTANSNDFNSYSEYSDFRLYNSYLGIKNYVVHKYNNYKQYVGIDNDENYYIFNETSPMQYTVILDTHTIDLPEFTEKYNASSNESKVGLNTEKIKEAINDKDYNYIYNKLNATFKHNNFKTVSDLQVYLQSNLYSNNKFEYLGIEEQNGVYVATVKVTNQKKSSESKNIKMVMKLN